MTLLPFALLLAWLSAGALPAAGEALSLRWIVPADDPTAATLEAGPLPAAVVASPPEWSTLLTARVASADPGLPSIAGRYSLKKNALRFQPSHPLQRGVRYVAKFDGSTIPELKTAGVLTANLTPPAPKTGPATTVTTITPGRDALPANLLKFYLHFSGSMSRGAYQHIHLREASGRKVEYAFLELTEELWDPEMKRLTLLLDPGRVKRGLRPNEESGQALHEGKKYLLTIDPAWKDAAGRPLKERFSKTFSVTAPDYQQPAPKDWKLASPAAGTRKALKITFDESLDAALAHRLIVPSDRAGTALDGTVTLSPDGTTWTFVPATPWKADAHLLTIDHLIEDLAGNSIARRFEEVIEPGRKPGRRNEAAVTTLTFTPAAR